MYEDIIKTPIYESKTVQCYPSSYEEAAVTKIYEAGLWELVSSVRSQEYSGTTISTFTRLTFRRNKNMHHYYEIAQASEKLEYFVGKEPNTKPADNEKLTKICCVTFGGLFLAGLFAGWQVNWFISIPFFVAAVAAIVIFAMKVRKLEKEAQASRDSFYKRKEDAEENLRKVKRECGY